MPNLLAHFSHLVENRKVIERHIRRFTEMAREEKKANELLFRTGMRSGVSSCSDSHASFDVDFRKGKSIWSGVWLTTVPSFKKTPARSWSCSFCRGMSPWIAGESDPLKMDRYRWGWHCPSMASDALSGLEVSLVMIISLSLTGSSLPVSQASSCSTIYIYTASLWLVTRLYSHLVDEFQGEQNGSFHLLANLQVDKM